MGAFDFQTKVIRADWWEGKRPHPHSPNKTLPPETVTIRELTFAEQQRLNQAFNMESKIQLPAGEGRRRRRRRADREEVTEMLTKMDMSNFNQLTLEAAIVEWTFYDKNGRPLEVTPNNIRGMRNDYADFILDEIDALNAPRDEEDEESFRGDDRGRATEGRGAAAGGAESESDNGRDGMELAGTSLDADHSRQEPIIAT